MPPKRKSESNDDNGAKKPKVESYQFKNINQGLKDAKPALLYHPAAVRTLINFFDEIRNFEKSDEESLRTKVEKIERDNNINLRSGGRSKSQLHTIVVLNNLMNHVYE